MEAGQWSPLCTLIHASQRYLCHCRAQAQAGSSLPIHVTNGNEVWRSDETEEALEEWDAVRGLTSQGLTEKLRETFKQNTPVLEMQGSLASLSFPVDSGKVTLDLLRLPVSEARAHVQELLFDLTDRVFSLEKQLKATEDSGTPSVSPVKPSQRNRLVHIPDVDVRKRGSVTQAKKRTRGESLINPGSKRERLFSLSGDRPNILISALSGCLNPANPDFKKAARGVDFDES